MTAVVHSVELTTVFDKEDIVRWALMDGDPVRVFVKLWEGVGGMDLFQQPPWHVVLRLTMKRTSRSCLRAVAGPARAMARTRPRATALASNLMRSLRLGDRRRDNIASVAAETEILIQKLAQVR